ncbi:MexE family multidrug efflux RND transporter periplasmic adaptor subunit [Neiella marina]|uniref:MexE family multidrug efflux RND transporter periplasmic adaptor subunit n=1 Tax=Neiella marina TaxID=508461 RepID=A0A8J2UA25_9GAMM|nr:efflux RND transporter periplasmic adaptor subunit [Neiella marina]GGA89598.1 MexE family multidrug efflux RND transporter periplasmic adaptor subunit [Neiella marina]
MKRQLSAFVLAATIITLVGCSDEATTPITPPATPIDVATVAEQAVQAWYTYTTRLEAPQEVDLMPRVSGVIKSIEFVEGQVVKEGDLLFKLDARPFEAEVARLKAQVKSAVAALEQANNENRRAQRLRQNNAISAEQAESRSSAARQRQAELQAFQAQLRAAELDLEFTQITAPISGVVSRAEITKGNNVNANQSILTSIVSNHEMYAYFDVDERTWNKSFSDVTTTSELPAVLQLTGSDRFSHVGRIDFIDNAIDTHTGTLRVRATFAPQQGKLRAGSFARIRVAASAAHQQILIPDRAIGTDLKNRFVLTVSAENTLEYRLVTTGERYGEYRVITQGLKPTDVIAVNGPAKVGPGMPIEPRPVQLDLSSLELTITSDSAEPTPLIAKR